MTEKQAEALEKLNRGVQESRKEVQQRTLSLAQDYFKDSAEALRQQIEENRAALENLPDQVPGGREEAFQTMFQELMDNYSAIEECISEARENVANLDTDSIRRQGEVEATDAARREARELGIDLTEVEGTGSEGRVTVEDVKKLAEKREKEEEPRASEAARRKAEELGLDLSQIEGTGSEGQITVGDVTSFGEEAAGQAQEAAAGAAGQVQDAAGQVAEGVSEVVDQAGGAVEEAGEKEPAVDVSDAARREAEARGIDLSKVKGTGANGRIVYWDVAELPDQTQSAEPVEQLEDQASDVAGQVTGGAQDAAGQATEQAGQVASQAGETASQVADGAQGAAGQLTEQAVGATQQVADRAGQGSGAEEDEGGPKVTKAARRKAEELGVDLSKVQGSGAGGLITIKDVVGA